MSVTEVRKRAERFQNKSRLVLVINGLNAALLAAAFGWAAMNAPNWIIRAGCASCVLFALAFAGWAYRRRPGRMPGEASGAAVLEFYRRELRRMQMRRTSVLLLVLPVLLGLVMIAAGAYALRPGASLLNMAPLAVMLAAWSVVMWLRTGRYSRKLQRQIDEADAVRLE
ncbi:hypothetical protein [Phenylobacterium sp.]|uniref:hypothetical protein n=1 Tax=Phenylobacterium sp. TaxID=1871053 RepID=UPI00356A62DA